MQSPTFRSLTIAAAAAALAAQPLAAQAPGRTMLVGQVIDAESKAPLAAATVRVLAGGVAVSTGPDGQFQVRVPPGQYSVTIDRLGYETAVEMWEVSGPSLDVGILELAPDAVRLEALEVVADRMERSRLASAYASRGHTELELAASSAPNALEFVITRQALIRVPCGILATGGSPDCVRVRGEPVRPCVVVDDSPLPGGFNALQIFPTRDLARINVYRGGAFVQAYTKAYLRTKTNSDWTPPAVDLQMVAYCHTS